ncbi:glucan endo-1,3-beta-glucosidase GII-like [Panicum hallii]|uniref:glucan endo-1,3-beta-glucosidase GII-like n=1 Tax=Panicum hallii TaxID=206008 RepID=UPI000DF4DFCD|nr:glucan endo-1,3-beta-glucosidase GII-like [Panicum hallii]
MVRDRSNGMRIYSADAPSCSLQALCCSGIDAIIDETNLNALVSDTSGWVQANFQPYLGNVMFKYSTVGNEVEGGDTQKILPAMQSHNTARSLRQASAASRCQGLSKWACLPPPPCLRLTAHSPTHGHGGPIVKFLASNGSPLLANVYPWPTRVQMVKSTSTTRSSR